LIFPKKCLSMMMNQKMISLIWAWMTRKMQPKCNSPIGPTTTVVGALGLEADRPTGDEDGDEDGDKVRKEMTQDITPILGTNGNSSNNNGNNNGNKTGSSSNSNGSKTGSSSRGSSSSSSIGIPGEPHFKIHG